MAAPESWPEASASGMARVSTTPPRDVLTPALLARAYGVRATVVEIEGSTVVLPIAPLS